MYLNAAKIMFDYVLSSLYLKGIIEQAKPFRPSAIDFSFRRAAQIRRKGVLLEVLQRCGSDVRFRFLFCVAPFVLFLFVVQLKLVVNLLQSFQRLFVQLGKRYFYHARRGDVLHVLLVRVV